MIFGKKYYYINYVVSVIPTFQNRIQSYYVKNTKLYTLYIFLVIFCEIMKHFIDVLNANVEKYQTINSKTSPKCIINYGPS